MHERPTWLVLAGMVVFLTACAASANRQAGRTEAAADHAAGVEIDWTAVDAAMDRSGSTQPGGVHRFGMPRTDLVVTSRGVRILPSLALGSWVAMKQSGPNEVVAMGDLVLTDEELNAVVARLQHGGIGQTAIHKHLLEMSPSIWWAHVHAHGNPVEIARTIRDALALTGTPAQSAGGDPAPQEMEIDTAAISSILGRSGRNNSGV
ncbi:MAG: DUF1259 domain-containing protein, partial [Longimicrobiales bacterium]